MPFELAFLLGLSPSDQRAPPSQKQTCHFLLFVQLNCLLNHLSNESTNQSRHLIYNLEGQPRNSAPSML